MHDRAVSAFPISIATSLALESLFIGRQAPYDPSRPIPNTIDIRNYSEVWINIRTLIRNILGALSDSKIITAQDILDILAEEIEIIKDIFRVEGRDISTPIFYYSDYDRVYRHLYHQSVKLRLPSTPAQVLYQKNEELVVKEFFKYIDKKDKQHIRLSDALEVKRETSKKVNMLLLSHIPYDLLSAKHFSKLDLLESHTGLLKPRGNWGSKLYKVPNGNMTLIPFMRKTLMIFGDNVMFKPMPIELRRNILAIAEKRRWNGLTTKEKVMMDIDLDIADKYVVSVIASL